MVWINWVEKMGMVMKPITKDFLGASLFLMPKKLKIDANISSAEDTGAHINIL